MTSRRGFLGMLGAAIAGAMLDPDEFLWTPGRKLISIPKPPVVVAPTLGIGDIITIAGRYAVNPRTLKYGADLQRFVVTGLAHKSGVAYGLNVFPHAEGSVKSKDIVRHNHIDLSDPANYRRTA